MKERIIGYIVFGVGICVMWYTVMQVYMLLTNQIKPFEVFQEKTVATTTPPKSQSPAALTPNEVLLNPAGMQEMQTSILTSVMDKQVNKSLNLGSTLFFYYFLMLFGFRLSSLGTQLMRPINVKLRSNEYEVMKEDASKNSPAFTTVKK
jgi:hypothetical protein